MFLIFFSSVFALLRPFFLVNLTLFMLPSVDVPRYLLLILYELKTHSSSNEWNMLLTCMLTPAWARDGRGGCGLLAVCSRFAYVARMGKSIIVGLSSRLELDRRLRFNDTRESNEKARGCARSGVTRGPFSFFFHKTRIFLFSFFTTLLKCTDHTSVLKYVNVRDV